MNPLFAGLPTTIFTRMSGLARELGAVNLGQGFPDFGWPEDVLARCAEATVSGSNQYAPMQGLPELREAVARYYNGRHGLDLTAANVTVTSGATEALTASILGLVSPGDEVVLVQPVYDSYLPIVRQAGGVPRLIRLSPPGWRITEEAVAEAFSDRTRLLIFNNPHNPTARSFDEEELGLLAAACVRHDAFALSDEVWEEVVFDGIRHRPLASMPGMAERTVKVGSAGKIFSLTGWKIGWAVAPERLSEPVWKAHQFITFSSAPNLQTATAYGLSKDEAYFAGMRASFAAARDRLTAGLRDAGYAVLPAQGTYFLCVDLPASGISVDDVTFCERSVREAGIAAIPLSPFYAEDPVTSVVRLCFAKQAKTISLGLERLAAARTLFA